MEALVTGGAGFIGSAITRSLIERGDHVRVLDNLIAGRKEAVPRGVELIVGDIRDLETARAACDGIEIVFHNAAVKSVPRSIDDPELTNDVNVNGSLTVLAAASEKKVRRLIYSSSSSVYGDTNGAVNHEELKPDPMSPYAVSKLAGEHYARVWATLGKLDTVALRYFNVFGPGQRPESKYAAVFPSFIAALLSNRPPQIFGDGEQTRDFTYIDDVVAANLSAAEAQRDIAGEVINIGDGKAKSVNEVLKAVSDAVGTWIEPEHLPPRRAELRHTEADNSKARAKLDWVPTSNWTQSVESTAAWIRRALNHLQPLA